MGHYYHYAKDMSVSVLSIYYGLFEYQFNTGNLAT